MREYLYNENDNLSAMVTAQPELLLTLSHFGISMGFGDKTIAQVCAEHGVAPQFFLLICEVYSNDNFMPSHATLMSTPMDGLVPYLLRSHDYYLNHRLTHIGQHLDKIADMLPARAGKAIKQFFNAYVEEVREHFAHEENTVYPHISHLLGGEGPKNFKIKDFLASHGNLEDKLSDLVQIIFKYLPAGDDDAIDMIFDILQLSRDLRKHAIIEDKILGPYVKQLEKAAKS
jgi:regulator of cell morphogenesis and NO signaling